MASLSHTIKSDFRALPRHFRGEVPKLIVLLNGVSLFLFWVYIAIQGVVGEVGFVALILSISLAYLLVMYLVLVQRSKKTLYVFFLSCTQFVIYLFVDQGSIKRSVSTACGYLGFSYS